MASLSSYFLKISSVFQQRASRENKQTSATAHCYRILTLTVFHHRLTSPSPAHFSSYRRSTNMYIIWHEKTALKHISMFPLPDCRSPSLHFDLPKSTSPKHTNGNFYKWTRPSPKFLFLSGVKSRFVPPSRDTTTLYPAHLCHTHYCVRAAEPSTQPHTLWYYTATTYFIAVVTVVSLGKFTTALH